MSVLHLTLKKEWFGKIASGEKKEEYREIKPYWINRLTWHEFHKNVEDLPTLLHAIEIDKISNYKTGVFRRDFEIVAATNGYGTHRPNIKWQHKGIRIGTGKEEWGAEQGKQYFILEIGEIIK